MVLAKISTLNTAFPGTSLPAGWVNNGATATVANGGVGIPASTGFGTSVGETLYYDPTSSAVYGKLLFSLPRNGTAAPIAQVVLTPGGSHSPTIDLVLEFDYNQVLASIRSAGVDDGNGVTAAAVTAATSWWRLRDDGAQIYWELAPDGVSWSAIRAVARPAWWNSTDGVKLSVVGHSATGTASQLYLSNINNLTPVLATEAPAPIARFDNFNTAVSAPNPVTNLQYFVTDGTTVALSWSPPTTGAAVIGFTVDATPLNVDSPALPSQTTTSPAAVFTGLAADSSYIFVVKAFNAAGSSTPVGTPAITINPNVNPVEHPTKLANALPTTVKPGTYVPLLLTNDPDDGDTLANLAVRRLADLTGNGWRPYLGNVEVACLQVAAYMAADLRTLTRDMGATLFSSFGEQILQAPRQWDAPSQITTTWTALDTAGHTVPSGTQVSFPGGDTTPLTFTLRGDLVIPAGSTSVTGVVMLCDQTGAVTNQVPTGPLELQSSVVWMSGVTVTVAASGGTDAESDDDYRDKLALYTRTLGLQVILPQDYALAAQQADSAVYRALAVPNYDANSPGTRPGPERTVSVFLLGADGLPVGPDVATSVQSVLQARREVNFKVVVLNGSNNAIAPTYVGVAVAAHVVPESGATSSAVHDAVVAALTSFLSPANWEGGTTVPPTWSGRYVIRPHDLATIINAVPGVDHINNLTIGGGAVPITGTDNYALAPSSFTKSVLPAGTTPNSTFWPSGVSTISVVMDSPAAVT